MDQIQKTVLYEQGMKHDFLEEVHNIPGGHVVKRCIQCGTCSGSCPVSWAMEESPRQIIAMIRAGMREKVLSSPTIWTCASCYNCTVRCPQEIKITDIMYILKRMSLKESKEHSKAGQVLADTFTEMVEKYGRNHELELMGKFALSKGILYGMKNSGLGMKLKMRGRMPFGGQKVKDLQGLRKIIAKAKVLGGEK